MDASMLDLVFTQAGAKGSTPYEWNAAAPERRREIIVKLLPRQRTPVLEALAELAEESAATAAGATTAQPTLPAPPPITRAPSPPVEDSSRRAGPTNAVVDASGQSSWCTGMQAASDMKRLACLRERLEGK
jgi:hypothetical protein